MSGRPVRARAAVLAAALAAAAMPSSELVPGTADSGSERRARLR